MYAVPGVNDFDHVLRGNLDRCARNMLWKLRYRSLVAQAETKIFRGGITEDRLNRVCKQAFFFAGWNETSWGLER
jgi:hypothetical protein